MSDCCATCGTLFSTPEVTGNLAKGGSLEVERPRSALAKSADSGCKFCQALLAFDMRAENAIPSFQGRRSAAMYEQMLRAHPEEKVRFEFQCQARVTGGSAIHVRRPDNVYAGTLVLEMRSLSERKKPCHS